MSNHAAGVIAQPKKESKQKFSARLKTILLNILLNQFSGISVAGILGTLIVAYFHNLSAYDDKVAALAKDDLTAAEQILSEITTALSNAATLQQRLISDFYAALVNDSYKDDGAYLTTDAREMYKSYLGAYLSLHQNYDLLARKAEIYLDWPSDRNHDAETNTAPNVDPLNISTLGKFGFDCEKYMPTFAEGTAPSPLTNKDDHSVVYLDWNSAKHHVLSMEYCFNVTHQGSRAAMEWASKNHIDPTDFQNMTNNEELLNKTRPTNQVLRLNKFIALAMGDIERMRVRYRPNGYWCSVPGVREWIEREKCLPVRIATGAQRPDTASSTASTGPNQSASAAASKR